MLYLSIAYSIISLDVSLSPSTTVIKYYKYPLAISDAVIKYYIININAEKIIWEKYINNVLNDGHYIKHKQLRTQR